MTTTIQPSLSHSTASDPRQLATLPDILAALAALQSDEAELTNSLSDLLSSFEPISTSLSKLKSLSPQLDALSTETQLLDQTVSYTARTAQDVGGRVQSLDEEMKRVREASERVSQIIDLKVLCFYILLGHLRVFLSRSNAMPSHRSHPCTVPSSNKTGSRPLATVPEQWLFLSMSSLGRSPKQL